MLSTENINGDEEEVAKEKARNLDFSGDYKATLNEVIAQLEAQAKETSREYRIETITTVTDAYIEQVEDTPDASALHRLANVILSEELTDTRNNQVSATEYPFLSARQLEARRTGKERKRRRNTKVVLQEVPMVQAINVATDGSNHTLPRRSFFNPF